MMAAAFLVDVGVGLVAGYAGTKAMAPVTMAFYERESEEDRNLEEQAQTAPAFEVAAQKMAGLAGVDLSDVQRGTAGMVLHWGLGLGWGVVTVLLRRATGFNPLTTGLLSGFAMFVLIDEGANTVFGFAAPPRSYPLASHVRGLVGHLVYGAATAVTAEAIYALGSAAPRR